MKKIFNVMAVAAMAFAAVVVTSCGGDGGETIKPEEPEEVVEMGHYSLYFEDVDIYHWPDSKEEIEEAYEAYKKSVNDALKIDTSKEYKWTEIEADKARLQKAFDGLGNFEFKVKAALNIMTYHTGVTLKAYKDGQSSAAIDFGKKDITCIKDIPEGTSQLYFVMESAEAAAPSAKEYCDKVRQLFADALKDVFADDFELVVTKGTVEKHTYYNLANYPGDRDKLVEQMIAICEKVELPELSDEIKAKALEEYPKMDFLLRITFYSYDPFVYAPSKSDKKILNLTVNVK